LKRNPFFSSSLFLALPSSLPLLSAFERESDPYFRLPCANSFYGIARQTYKDWYLLLNGDGISSQGVGRVFQALKAAGVPEERVLFRNMEPSRRERFVYKEI
jgi:hypothetical protein